MTWKKTEYTHGLRYDKQAHTITICKNGFFANFHDCYSDDPFYQKKPSIRFEDIIKCGPLYQIELDSNAWYEKTYDVKTIDNDQISLTELDRDLIFLYGLSILARYNVQGWAKILSGVENPISTNIKIINHLRFFTRAVELVFPNLILNEIYLKKISIYSPMKLNED